MWCAPPRGVKARRLDLLQAVFARPCPLLQVFYYGLTKAGVAAVTPGQRLTLDIPIEGETGNSTSRAVVFVCAKVCHPLPLRFAWLVLVFPAVFIQPWLRYNPVCVLFKAHARWLALARPDGLSAHVLYRFLAPGPRGP